MLLTCVDSKAPHSRWLRQSTESSEETPAAQAVAALEERQGDRPPLRRPRWANRCFEGLAEIGVLVMDRGTSRRTKGIFRYL